MITSISFLDYPEKKKNSREENNRDCSWRRGRTKKIQNKERLSEHNETSIKFLKEAISCIPLANEDGADFENIAFLFNPPAGHFIVIGGKSDWEYSFPDGGSSNITCKCVRKPWLMYLWNKGTFGFSAITLSLFLAEVVIVAFRST